MSIEIRLLAPADHAAVDAFLLPHAASAMFLRSNLRASGLIAGSGPYHGDYAGRFESGVLTDVAAHYWTNNLIMFAPTAAADLAVFLTASTKRAVKGIMGPWLHCVAALDALGLRHRAQDPHEEDLFSLALDQLQIPSALAGKATSYRRARLSDLDLLATWRIAYEIETLGYAPGPDVDARARDTIGRLLSNGDLWVALHDGTLVAMSGINARLPDMVQVGGVHTPKSLRGRGYARIAVAGSLLDCRSEGAANAILFTETRNSAAKRVYSALGFRRVGDYGLILL